MATGDGHIQLRSYRLAFELERRIHRIDSFRIPLPYGIPLAALGWAAATLVLVVVASPLPVVGAVLGLAPWPVRIVFLPGLAAHLLCRMTSDGRPVHEALAARAAFVTRKKRRLGVEAVADFRVDVRDIPIAPDERGEEYRAGVVRGPATIALRQPARLEIHGAVARLVARDPHPLMSAQDMRLREGQRLVVA